MHAAKEEVLSFRDAYKKVDNGSDVRLRYYSTPGSTPAALTMTVLHLPRNSREDLEDVRAKLCADTGEELSTSDVVLQLYGACGVCMLAAHFLARRAPRKDVTIIFMDLAYNIFRNEHLMDNFCSNAIQPMIISPPENPPQGILVCLHCKIQNTHRFWELILDKPSGAEPVTCNLVTNWQRVAWQ